MSSAQVGSRRVEKRPGCEQQRTGLDGQHGAARHPPLVGSTPVAFGKPVVGLLA